VILGIFMLGSAGQAERITLGDEALKQALVGKSIHLDTPFGVVVPITFHGNGLMSGKAGILAYLLGGEADKGRWWVADGKLCQKWFKWLDAQPSCMRLQQDGKKLYWQRDDGLSGTATIVAALPPGATSAPQGLGGPVVDLPGEPHEAGQPAKTPLSVPLFHAAVHPIVRAVPPERREAHQPPASLAAGAADRDDHAPWPWGLYAPPSRAFATAAAGRWCHAAGASGAAEPAAPDLVLVARLPYAGTRGPWSLPWSASACFAPEPALREVAKLGADVLSRSLP
jgi:hypothetical protein